MNCGWNGKKGWNNVNQDTVNGMLLCAVCMEWVLLVLGPIIIDSVFSEIFAHFGQR